LPSEAKPFWFLSSRQDSILPVLQIAIFSVPSSLAAFRISCTERVINPATGKSELKETELVRRFKKHDKYRQSQGFSTSILGYLDSDYRPGLDMRAQFVEAAANLLSSSDYLSTVTEHEIIPAARDAQQPSCQVVSVDRKGDAHVLRALREDLIRGVCGIIPSSGLKDL
jgi:hypothetical protein